MKSTIWNEIFEQMKRKHYHLILIISFVFINSTNTEMKALPPLNIWQQHQPQYSQCMNNIVNGNTVPAEQLSNIIQERVIIMIMTNHKLGQIV